MNDKNASEQLAYHQNSTGVVDHTYDYNGINLLKTEDSVDAASIQSINETNHVYMNDIEIFINKYYAPFLPSKNNEDVSLGAEYD